MRPLASLVRSDGKGLEGLHRRLVQEGPRSLAEILFFYTLLVPCGWLYGGLMRLRATLYKRGLLRSYRAPVPVISVGNLSVGGTGKTPMVDYLVRRLRRDGYCVAVVSRGYGGSGVKGVGVVSAGEGPLLPATVCGDEPFLLARRNPGALFFVAHRRATGVRQAVERYGAEIVLLDDGFQHLAVQRDLDIVLLDARRPLGNGRILPAGNLRESPRALARGGLFVLTRWAQGAPLAPELPGPVLHCRHQLGEELLDLMGSVQSLAGLAGKRGVAFAGIADPEAFFADLQGRGLELVTTLGFADHVPYGDGELALLQDAAAGADYFITTEKDGVKLAGRELPLPCYQLPLTLEFVEEEGLEPFLSPYLSQGDSVMTLPKDLLEILACPKCKGTVRVREDESAILCEQCRLAYPVRDGIPVMLIDEAESL